MPHHTNRGPGTILKWGGGGLTSPGVQCNPYPKLKTPDFAHYFLGGTQVHVQKQTKIKMNDIDSSKLGGDAPPVQTLERLAPPLPPPPPGSRAYALVHQSHFSRWEAGTREPGGGDSGGNLPPQL